MNRLIILLALIGCAETPHNNRGAVARAVPAVTGDDTGLGDDTGSEGLPVDTNRDGFASEASGGDDCAEAVPHRGLGR